MKRYGIVSGMGAGGNVANAGWFGDGRDGDLYVADGEELVIDVALDEGQIVKRYKNVYIGVGAVVRPSNRCNGMVWNVSDNFECHGTINMDKLAPLLNDRETECMMQPHVKLCGGITGGKGGNGGGGNTGTGAYAMGMFLYGYSAGGEGGAGFVFGGGPAAGGGGGGAALRQTGDDRQGEYLLTVANGAPGTRAPIGTTIPYPQASTTYDGIGAYGNGGNSYPASSAKGGAGYGGSGAANYFYKQSNGYLSSPTGYAGKAGDGLGGGAFFVYVGGSCVLSATAEISADGGNGANGVTCGSNTSYKSGAGGGAGGGVIAIVHSGDFTNNGSVHANGGTAGTNSATPATDGEAGTVLITTLDALLAA